MGGIELTDEQPTLTYHMVPQEVCILRHEIIDTRIDAIEKDQQGIREDIREVRDLQKQILYAIIGVAVATILTLVGVLAGRAIDLSVFIP